MKRSAIIYLSAIALFISSACQRKTGSNGHEGHNHGTSAPAGQESHDSGHEGMIPLKDVPGARTQAVEDPKELNLWFPAAVIADESSQFVLSSPVNGILGALHVSPGQHVESGTVLATVRSPELARLHSDWVAAKSRLAKAESALAREQRLDAKKATSQKELDEAISEDAIAKAEEESARLALESLGLKPGHGGAIWTLKAPRAGSVVEYKAISGQGISAGQDLGFFLATGPVIVRMELAISPNDNLKPGRAFPVKNSSGHRWNGKLEGIVPAISSDTMRQTYRLRLTGNALPLPGTPVEVQIHFPPSITLPQVALQQVDGIWGVFIAHHGFAEFRPVVRGQDIKGEVVILNGLKPGQTVVTDGAYLLKAYQRKLASPDEEEGHAH
jgi:cobalt-zinc-cadmium efflux system membrane fusion protein